MQLESRFIANTRLIAPDTDQHGFYELEQLWNNFLRYLQRVEAIKFACFYFPCTIIHDSFTRHARNVSERKTFCKGKRRGGNNRNFRCVLRSFFLSAFTFDLWGQILENANSFRRIIFDMHCIPCDCLNIDNLQGRKVSRMKNWKLIIFSISWFFEY